MIPSLIGESTTSPGERDLFKRFQADPATNGWVVLHSLDLATHVRQVSGEADFLVVVPSLGVLCIEVKSHRSVRCEAGLWYLGNDAPTARSPFRQSAEAMHSVREAVRRRAPQCQSVLFWSAVCFTNCDFDQDSPEWHTWQAINSRRLREQPISRIVTDILMRARDHVATQPSGRWFSRDSSEPTARQVELLTTALRPTFEFYESPRSRRREEAEELRHYTEEQFVALDAMDSPANPRVIFEGPAGTGKTLLAVEEARRAYARGDRTLFVCFNRLLGEWLRRETEPFAGLVKTSTLHSFMVDVAAAAPPERAGSVYWSEELPEEALAAVLEGTASPPEFDLLIVDEAQDVLTDNYLDVLDAVLVGGLASGRWRFFGDFLQQSIYENGGMLIDAFVKQRSPGTPRYSLTRNCRNRPRVATFAGLLAGLRQGYGRVLREDNGIEPETLYYSDPDIEVALLTKLLEQLYEEGFKGEEIVVLSPRAQASVVETLTRPWRDRLRPLSLPPRDGYIRYGTIQAFKGLEAPAIIVTDVTSIGSDLDSSLFYVATTRPTERLYVLASESIKANVIQLLLNTPAR